MKSKRLRDCNNTEIFAVNCQFDYIDVPDRFAIIRLVGQRKRKSEKRPVFDSIRKPTAPPAKKFGEDKPEEVARPALRKTKHKKKLDPAD